MPAKNERARGRQLLLLVMTAMTMMRMETRRGAETDGEEKMVDGEENVPLRMRQMHGWSLS